jgi:archaellum component FlaC
MLGLFKKDSKVDPAELEKLRQKLSEVTTQPLQPAAQAQPQAAYQPQVIQPPPQQYTFVDPEKVEENERITNLIMQQIKELIEIDSNLNTKIKEIETKLGDNTNAVNNMKAAFDTHKQKMEVIDKNMEKFMGLYEIVTNRFNPFIVEEDQVVAKPAQVEKVQESKVEAPPAETQKAPVRLVPAVEDSISMKEVEKKEPESFVMNAHASVMAGEVAQSVNAQIQQAMAGLAANLSAQIKASVKEQIETSGELRQIVKSAVADELKNSGDNEPPRLRKIPKNYQFHLPNGFLVDSRQSLIDGLKSIDDASFAKYVDGNKNDFAQWIALALKEDALAQVAARILTRADMIDFCEKSL